MFEQRRRPTRRKTSIRKGAARSGQERPPRDPERFTKLNPSRDLKSTLQRFGLRPQKGFGQNFLIDEFALDTILEAADLSPTDTVLEVGPGLGVLTKALAERAGSVIAVEIDRGMVAALGELLADHSNVRVVEGDALKIEPTELVGADQYKVVANLPYYITSRLLRHFFESQRPPTRLVVMVQQEVAERIVAPAGDLSLLAVSVQYYGVPRIVGRLPPSAFYPPPKVASAILAVDVLPRPAVDVAPAQFFKVVSAGFDQPRKQLHNALPQKLWMQPGAASEALDAAGIDSSRRAQTLTLEEWATLARELETRGVV
jgi:16S rRNA (adenine1518-N6/adenine1519-N6)-dimethyltransferase